MASQLAPCPSCTRHFKVGSAACPFCGGEVPTSVPQRGIAAGRPLTRAALVFAGSAVVAACSSSSGGGEPLPAYGVAIIPDGGQYDAAYGVFVHPDAGNTGAGSGNPLPAYGLHAFDSGAPGEPDGGAVAAYGVFVDPDAGQK